jgi:hypothetical protein
MSGARFEIVIDGTPRTYRDREDYAREAALFLKAKQPHAKITVRDLQTGTVTNIEHPLMCSLPPTASAARDW